MKQSRQTAVGQPVPAPVGGLDTQSPLAAMPAQNAVILNNWIPRPGYVETRRGYIAQTTGGASPVETLMTWRGTGTNKLLACAGIYIYDVTAGGSFPSALYSSATSARRKYVNFANDAGHYTITVNGVDTPLKFDGTSITTTAITGTDGTITLDPKTLIDVMMHKRRLHFIEGNSLRVWFMPVNAIAGASLLLDLGPVFSKGGTLVGMSTWSTTAGITVDDFAAYMTTEGQVAVYQGTDPGNASAWALVGVYDVGIPLGSRALVKYGGDLAVLTTAGILPLSQALKIDRSEDNLIALTQKIQNSFSVWSRAYSANFGWEAIFYQKGSLAIVNIPVTELGTSIQAVQNVQTGAWATFSDIPAFCWTICNENIYFGSTSGVYQWDVGADDNSVPITFELKTAFNAMGQAGRLKRFTMIRPLLYCSSLVQPALEIDVDYAESEPTAVATVIPSGSTTPVTRFDWTGASGLGYVGAVRMALTLKGDTTTPHIITDVAGTNRLVDGSGNAIITQSPLPFDVPVQLTGFDVQFQPGGLL